MAFTDLYLPQPGWDLALDDEGFLLGVDGASWVVQAIRVRLSMQQGEWFLGQTAGVDWLGVVLVKGPASVEARDAVAEQILAVPSVARIVTLDLSVDSSRRLTVEFEVETLAGVIVGGTV